jgi:hypothetical protein
MFSNCGLRDDHQITLKSILWTLRLLLINYPAIILAAGSRSHMLIGDLWERLPAAMERSIIPDVYKSLANVHQGLILLFQPLVTASLSELRRTN